MKRGLLQHFITCILIIVTLGWASAQTLLEERRVDWSTAGAGADRISPDTVFNILDYGGDPTGNVSNHSAYSALIQAKSGMPGIIYFPPGTYFFSTPLYVFEESIIKGAGADSTFLLFNQNGNNGCILMRGTRSQITVQATNNLCKGQFHIPIADTAGISPGDYFMLLFDDTDLVNDSWAEGSVGQINRVTGVGADRIFIEHALRMNYMMVDSPYVEWIDPIQNAGVECLHIERQDHTVNNHALIQLSLAAECWVTAVEGNMASYSHVTLGRSTKCTISGNYFHHAHQYGDGGDAYGVAIQFTSGDNLIENNIFEHLRHSILLQAGVNGNVIAYNYSTDPFKTVFGFPTDNTADLVCHGNYPFANLFEGNIASFGIVDASHGGNGPYNTYFRNRMSAYGMRISNSNPDNNSQNIIGNECISYSLAESDHYEFGNNVNGTTTPPNTDSVDVSSYYLNEAPMYFDTMPWPSVGYPNGYGSGTIPAEERYLQGAAIVMDCPTHDACPMSLSVAGVGYIDPVYRSSHTINSDAVIQPFQQVIFQTVDSVILQSEFEVKLGGEFEVLFGGCN